MLKISLYCAFIYVLLMLLTHQTIFTIFTWLSGYTFMLLFYIMFLKGDDTR
ncbi:MAG: hypothetical protein K0Q49_2124 [Haloplasmataceae bacterium]|jgi:hypothetical protein|nr:hypothetical protein [Haloplasmataceae bacterium]